MKKVIYIFLLLLVLSSTFVSANWLSSWFKENVFGLSPSIASIQIRVKNANTTVLLSGATVVFRVGGNVIATKTTDSNGLTSAVNIEVGKTLYIDVAKSGYTSITNSNKGNISGSTTISAVLTLICTNDCITTGIKQCSGSGYISCGNSIIFLCTPATCAGRKDDTLKRHL